MISLWPDCEGILTRERKNGDKMELLKILLDILAFILLSGIGLWYIIISIRGLIEHRPHFLQLDDFDCAFIIIGIVWIGSTFFDFWNPGDTSEENLVALIYTIPFVFIGIYFIFRGLVFLRGYLVFGIDKNIISGIAQALEEKKYNYREAHENFFLPETDSTIYTSINSGLGVARIWIDPPSDAPILEIISGRLKAYSLGQKMQYSRRSYYCAIIIGFSLLIFGFIITILRITI